jgi:hypothetical protein
VNQFVLSRVHKQAMVSQKINTDDGELHIGKENVQANRLPPKHSVIGCSPQHLMGSPLALYKLRPEDEAEDQ